MSEHTITIKVNGAAMQTAARTLSELVGGLELDAARLVAEHNGAIVPPESFAEKALAEGDVVELIRFVGGG